MRRNRSDSAEAAVKAALSAALPELQPPSNVRISPEALKFWPAIIRARARAEWREVDLVVAAQLAECQALIEQESATLATEGMVLKNDRGGPIENPRHKILQRLVTREMALMRTLRIGGSAVGDPRNWSGARRAEHLARLARKEVEGDELLA